VIEREWREASDMRTSRVALAAVLIAAAVLRFWALGHGIPYAVAEDEPEIVDRAFNMMRSGSLDPRGFFADPALATYVQVVVSCARFIAGAIGGAWTSLDQATIPTFYVWGRAVTAAFGVATVLLVFQTGARWGARHALLAAGLMAVMPLHVRYSHFVLADTLLTFFVTLTLLRTLIAHEKSTVTAFAWAGAAAGLAAATKYSGAAAVLMPLLGCWMALPVQRSRSATALVIIGSAGGAYLLAAPYTLLDLPGFLNGIAALAGEFRHARVTEPPWITYVRHLRLTLGWPALLLAIGGLVFGLVRLVRGPGRLRWAVAIVFPLVHFWMISRQPIVSSRYLLPMIPALCVLAAAAVVSGVSLLRRYEIPRAPRRVLIAGLTIAALFPPALMAIAWNRDAARRRTFDLAYEWIARNVPRDAPIVVESRQLVLPPADFHATNIAHLRRQTYDEYVRSGARYLVASSHCYGPYFAAPEKHPQEFAEYMRIFEQSREVARFTPSAEHPGPELRIFQLLP
jgi:4-amino-4-deoxy-L-arabinose transferase-like glycosyltransferase